ncbi:syndecan isoform X2 [Anticarsia gemmatalis]|uniref:syndecan isoform X2 n=1 Tax=Anticarsia gemmatalis TaxID=129554 RepID=UPI003F75F64E
MHLRIYLWLSCVVLAGYVRATEDAAVEKPTDEPIVPVQNDVHSPPDHELFIDDADDGSGLDADESSGSGWGAGPGPDDEDGRAGSGDPPNGPPDDEDYATTTKAAETESSILDFDTPRPEETDEIVIPEQPDIPSASEFDPILPLDPRQFIPNSGSRPREDTSEEARGAGEEQPSRPDQTDISISGEDIGHSVEPSGTNVNPESRAPDKVVIMNAKSDERATSFFAQPGILAAVIGGAVVGLLCAILVVMFIVYRMRKKDEGSYALDEPKRSPAAASYGKGHNNREFYA